MPIAIGTDAYTDLAFATPYTTLHGLPEVSEDDLRRASIAIDRRFGARFIGVRSTALQPLQWPRLPGYDFPQGVQYDWILIDSFGNRREFTLVPPEVAEATVEMAALLATGTNAYQQLPARMTDYTVKIDVIEESIKYSGDGHVDNPLHKIEMILAPLLLPKAQLKLVR